MTRAHAAAEQARPRPLPSGGAARALLKGYRRFRHAVRVNSALAAPLAAFLLFAALTGLAVAHLQQGRADRLVEAERDVALRTGELVRRLDRVLAAGSASSPLDALRQALAAEPQLRGGRAWIADENGVLVASEPALSSRASSVADVLGAVAPLAVMAEGAGILRATEQNGQPALAAVRNLDARPGQVAITETVAEALRPWRETARIEILLLAAAGLILGGTVGAARLDAARANARSLR